MLELRKKDGNVTALGYAWLERVDFEPSDGLTLHFTGQKVKVSGRNLETEVRPNLRLLNGLIRHKISYLQESDGATAMEADRDVVLIERIELES